MSGYKWSGNLRAFLFSKPGDELGIEGEDILDGKVFAHAAGILSRRLKRIARDVQRLLRDGWRIEGGQYEVSAYHDDVDTRAQAAKRMKRIGVRWAQWSWERWPVEA